MARVYRLTLDLLTCNMGRQKIMTWDMTLSTGRHGNISKSTGNIVLALKSAVFAPPPPLWLKLQAPVLKLPQNLLRLPH